MQQEVTHYWPAAQTRDLKSLMERCRYFIIQEAVKSIKNSYEVRGDITAVFLNHSTRGQVETIISTSKLDLVKSFPNRWRAQWDDDTRGFYCVGDIRRKGEKRVLVSMHRLVTSCPDGLYVDHVNSNTLDNTDSNLRLATNMQNQQNRKGANRHNKSGVLGVSWHKHSRKYRAVIHVDGKHKHLGLFQTVEDAEHAVTIARKEHMGFSKEAATG